MHNADCDYCARRLEALLQLETVELARIEKIIRRELESRSKIAACAVAIRVINKKTAGVV